MPMNSDSEHRNKPLRIYHNPQCSKSREALAYLEQQGLEPEVIEYLRAPLGVEELRGLIRMLGIAPSSLIRAADFKRLGLVPTSDYEQLLRLLADHPAIMERPIVVAGNEARIGRPIENLYELVGRLSLRKKT
jgi:arsenate reductase